MPRDVLNIIEGKGFGGVYVISNEAFGSKTIKIGMATGDIAKRLRSYSTYYPNNFWIHALILYPNNWKKYLHAQKAEARLHNLFSNKDAIWGYKNQTVTEWYSLSNTQKEQLFKEMEAISMETEGTYSYFPSSHEIKLPSL